jgi:hypothetical protein
MRPSRCRNDRADRLADKDLLQLVGPRVQAMSVRDGSKIDEAGVGAKFGVLPIRCATT